MATAEGMEKLRQDEMKQLQDEGLSGNMHTPTFELLLTLLKQKRKHFPPKLLRRLKAQKEELVTIEEDDEAADNIETKERGVKYE